VELALGIALLLVAGAGPSRKAPQFGESWRIFPLELELMPVAEGTFQMGTDAGRDDERPAHQVTISKPFWMAKTELTRDQYQKIMGKGKGVWVQSLIRRPLLANTKPDEPMNSLNWFEAVALCQQLTEREKKRLPDGYVFRLPTEAEWEYAARGGSRTRGFRFSGAEQLDRVAWSLNNSEMRMHRVGEKEANELGLYDLSGNVWEWCHDWFGEYPAEPVTDPRGPRDGTVRVYRGGGWSYAPEACRVFSRASAPPTAISVHVGLRIVLAPALIEAPLARCRKIRE